ncbi:flagellar hook-length control protein FliK [Roseomonas genomospecies 6]|uniref:Flagellar hook-length control protein FliK n=1 Tax=Roseomonas genomospecies 6 TaxID=214106 RepID=A0A9W7TY49_9PROT|nr:flagellar hook-length control protein FliK [Roseomonas genomospecies 6]KAA0679051.1 flagellar hook-length control protein FliK [Roseomonas genomospecies 6]
MPSLPDALAAPPPRPVRSTESAAPSPGAPGEDGASGTPFADLMDDAGAEDETTGQPDSTTRTGGAPAGADAALAALLPLLTAPPPAPPPATAPGTAETGMVLEALPSGGLPATPPIAASQPPAQAAAQPAPPQPVAPLPAEPAAMPFDAASDGSAPDGTSTNGAPAAPPIPSTASGAKPDAAPLFQTADSPPQARTDAAQAPSPQLQQAMAQAGNNAASNGGTGQNPGHQNPGQGQGRGNPPAGLEALSAPAPAVDGATAPLPSTLAPPAVHAAAHYAAHPGESAAARLPAAQVANQLVRVVETGGGEFHIDLKPEELGPVRVVAELSGARVALHVQAESPETLALLRRDIHHLERALSDAGFELDGGTLNFSLRGDGEPRGFAFSGQGDGPGGREDGAGRAIRLAESPSTLPPERTARPIDGLVDISI